MTSEKWKSIGYLRRRGSSERRVEKTKNTEIVTTEHWDGRKDATVRPDVVRYGARMHSTGRKRGQVAEVREMTPKERRETHGDD